MRFLLFFAAVAAAGLLGGCSTFESRAREKSAVFAALTPEQQARLENKSIVVGDTEDMVFIALGKPDEIKTAATADETTTTWIYNRYWQEYQGEAYGGFVRRTVTNPKTGATSVYLEPISRPVYESRQQPVLRITFSGGKVSVVEQVKE